MNELIAPVRWHMNMQDRVRISYDALRKFRGTLDRNKKIVNIFMSKINGYIMNAAKVGENPPNHYKIL